MNPVLIVEQKITPLANQYSIYTATSNGAKGELLAFAKQKRLSFKEKVVFFTDASAGEISFSFRAEKVMDIHGKFFVEDSTGALLGTFQKDFKKSLLTSTWQILNDKKDIQFTFTESNKLLAAIRRFSGFLPIVGEFAQIIMAFFKYHFNVLNNSNNVIGYYAKTTIFRDHYHLSMNSHIWEQQDWRIFASMAVALDALQNR